MCYRELLFSLTRNGTDFRLDKLGMHVHNKLIPGLPIRLAEHVLLLSLGPKYLTHAYLQERMKKKTILSMHSPFTQEKVVSFLHS